jgi:predicted DNA-binding transcriptional regulator AlpA
MSTYSSRQVAQKLGIAIATLSNYISQGKIPEPKSLTTGGITVHIWTDEEIELVRHLLPKIANGRKTRYKKQTGLSSQQSAKTKAQPTPAVTRKKKPKKK